MCVMAPARTIARFAVIALFVAGGAVLLRPAHAQSPAFITVAQSPNLGPILADANGMTLYVFADDTEGMSACSGGCAQIWPPLQPPADGNLSLDPSATGTVDAFMRADGTMQVEYNGQPLYYFAGDMNP